MVVNVESGALVWREGVGGAVASRVGLVDDVVPLVTDLDGRYVALGPSPGEVAPGTIAPGRTETTIVVLAPSGEEHRVTLAGNVVPEAFSTELGTGRAPFVFLLEYLPAAAPTHYRVRVLDPVSGALSWPFNLRQKELSVDTEMAGISRDQVVAADRGCSSRCTAATTPARTPRTPSSTCSGWAAVCGAWPCRPSSTSPPCPARSPSAPTSRRCTSLRPTARSPRTRSTPCSTRTAIRRRPSSSTGSRPEAIGRRSRSPTLEPCWPRAPAWSGWTTAWRPSPRSVSTPPSAPSGRPATETWSPQPGIASWCSPRRVERDEAVVTLPSGVGRVSRILPD